MAKKQEPQPPKKGGALRKFINAADAAAEKAANRRGKVIATATSGPPEGRCYCGKRGKSNYQGTCGAPKCMKKFGEANF